MTRTRTVLAVAIAVIVIAAAAGVVGGSYQTSLGDIGDALVGTASPRTTVIVVDLRLPRVIAGLLVGAALGLAGAVFQTLSRNPLGSPDIVGFSAGSATGALVCLVLLSPPADPALGAWAGGVGALLIVLFLTRGAGLASERTILAGIALAALLSAANEFLLTRAPTEVARSATLWLFGSLSATSWADVVLLLVAAGVLAVLLASQRGALRMLELGDDVATSLGVPLRRSRLLLLLLAAGLTGTATAVSGPIGFVALAAPQLARRASRSAGIPLTASAAVGAALLLASDVLAQRLLAPLQLPVGLVTGAVGGAYLFWLVARGRRRR
ncbi:iron chelate uptake ABC transporter family permease subunit [Rathayibacter sp. VKM Ac-2759]|uniref:FecCD family ABC transporter permease n=1 Tax=Rathayibacter sp. VKM Ac-2759 TaxID=2609252 RepID=UPI0013185469|nr:iron chelate uptake ABC transporter family permease subunit [Rathayibacter sp. VKM Ac-2759]QHC66254.1 iron chelate uptake ABC transporter family permease subunit [Rathayibacter sp. VKM Ac-2759]